MEVYSECLAFVGVGYVEIWKGDTPLCSVALLETEAR